MATDFQEGSVARRKLILRDTLAILSLLLVTAVLFLITLFLFRSFSAHRADLALRWSSRGRQALQDGKAADAVIDLRTARDYELMLAQALGESGHVEESYQYFMGLWETEPGNGEINLQLARLAAKRKNRTDAEKFYRASIYGTWEKGDGVMRRTQARLELAEYFISVGDLSSARMELLVAGGNAPDSYALDLQLGNLLQQADDSANAWKYYSKAVEARPDDPVVLEAAGRLAYQLGDYDNAHRLLQRALVEHAATHSTASLHSDDTELMDNAARILQLMPQPNMSPRDRTVRILGIKAIAKKRLAGCSTKFAPDVELPLPLQTAASDLDASTKGYTLASLQRDSAQQQIILHDVFNAEVQAQKFCGPATGDDALLLSLVNTSSPSPPSTAERNATANDSSN
jgi:tetratricopeptide (TPR) repeat protein